MTATQFASRRGVGKSAVSNWKKAGLLVFGEGDGGKVMIDVERSEARMNSRMDPMRGRPASAATAPIAAAVEPEDDGSPTMAAMRMDKLREDLFAQRMKNATAAGELVARVDVERRSGEAVRMLRERLQGQFRNIAERLAAESDARAIMSLGEQLIDRVFAEVADDVEAGLLDADDEPVEADQAEAA